MQAIRLRHPAAIASLQSVALPDPGQPARGQIRVRLHASSLNFHDLGVVLGQMPTADGRIPMSDGAGVVEAVGPEVDEFAVGDQVVSTFFPQWLGGG
ncbi:alcohol dehydrogenase catalytic domain-containing protein, partial [Xanthomonas citri]